MKAARYSRHQIATFGLNPRLRGAYESMQHTASALLDAAFSRSVRVLA
jgi:hypothetical protein